MAIPSSSSSSFVPRWNWDVFLSFRGEDTRNNFISHLHHALIQKGVNAFIDDNLRRGEKISPALVEAIEGSRIAVVVFSTNFASSTWCLDEVVKIMECRESKGQMVRPVFLRVDPSELRKGTGTFASFMAKHEGDFKDNPEKVNKWRQVLREAASLSGWHIRDGVESESEIIKKIVEEVSSKLSRPYFHVARHPVALEHHVQSIHSILLKNFNTVGAAMVGISGVGGIGKTSIAKAIFNLIADQFEGSSFLLNVRDTSRRYGLAELQQALLSDMLGDPDVKVGYSLTGVKLIQERLHDKRVLLVLDDVETLGILRDLLGDGHWFGSGSRIIVTARKEEALVGHCVEIYKVEQLNYDDGLQLFCWNAFQTPSPARDYELLSFSFMSCINRIPLFLIVMGSYLKGKNPEEWRRAFSRLKELIHEGKCGEAARISFENLETHERDIFLDIACLFNGEDKDYAVKQWDRCNFYPDSGLAILAERSLISIDSNKIWMHDMIHELGQEIVNAESSNDPSRCSRLWRLEDVMQALKGNSDIGSSCIEGIRLDTVEPEDLLMITQEIKKKEMKRLRVFIARDIRISRCPEYLSRQFSFPDIQGIGLPAIAETGGPRFASTSDELIQPDDHENDLSDTAESWGVEQLNRHDQVSSIISLNFKPIKAASRSLFSKLRGKWKKREKLEKFGGFGNELEKDLNKRFKRFSLKELHQATNSFSGSNVIGMGGFGTVYFGCLVDGQSVAVKLFKDVIGMGDYRSTYLFGRTVGGQSVADNKIWVNRKGESYFENECRVHYGNNHKNIVRLIGFLAENDDDDLALVYEYLSNGSLYEHLHGRSSVSTDQVHTTMSSWSGRLKVALDIARGVEYLHVYAVPPVIHRDVKPSNILLDSDCTAKISDFGLAACITAEDDEVEEPICGTRGYLDPEYFRSGKYSTKSDVYGFGVVLLELLSGLKALTSDENGIFTNLPVMAGNYIISDRPDEILDPKMPASNPQEMEAVRDIIFLAAKCTKLNARDRPSMTQVVYRLYTGLMKCTSTSLTLSPLSSPVSAQRVGNSFFRPAESSVGPAEFTYSSSYCSDDDSIIEPRS